MIRLQWLAMAAALSGGLSIAVDVLAARAPGDTVTLQITVTGVRNAKGVIHVDICRQAEFLKNCPVQTQAAAVAGTTIITIANLAPGTYAAQVFHDENNNTKVDRALFGIPKEGVGFSNDAPIRFAPPKWADAQFQLAADKTITLKLRYFIGGARRQ